MKAISKEDLLEKNLIQSTLLEKEILLNNKHPFLVNLSYVFQTNMKIYFVMGLVRGGELKKILKRADRISEEHAKFYVM